MTDYKELTTREAFGKIIAEMGASNNNIVVLDADLSRSTMTKYFAQAFPGRFVECGLTEQNMIGIAAGLASCGKVPLASTFAVFASSRVFDQVRMSVAQPKANVKVVATHGGITVGEDGSSHQAIEDVGMYCLLPNFNVIVPADAIETVEIIKTAVSTAGPFYIRLGRSKTPLVYPDGCKFQLGKADVLRKGKDATVIAMGIMVSKALEAAESLSRSGIDCRVLNMSTVKPMDEKAVLDAAVETGAIVTAEEHLLNGGMGSMVARLLSSNHPVPLELIGINDIYCKSGKPEELLEMHGLTASEIEASVKKAIARKAAK
jgi:transketolase